MPLSKGTARFNRSVTNRITRPFAARLRGFGVVHHRGRNSGTSYQTPVNAWRHDDSIVVALTYGPEVDWLKNAKAAEESVIVMDGQEIRVGRPSAISTDSGKALVPGTVARILGLISVDEFVDFPVITPTS